MPNENLPKHIGIIMDGNGRWATGKMLPRNAGHKKGANVLTKVTKYANKIGIMYLSVFAFSTENFKRPEEEVEGIFELMRTYINDQKNHSKENIRFRFLGNISVLPKDIIKGIGELEAATKNNTGLNFNIAFNYGGRQDILQAAKLMAEKYKNHEIENLSQIDENEFSKFLYTKEQLDIDLIIRTSGEQRISNFMIWQAAYAEFYFSPVLWPDFDTKEFDKAIEVFRLRSRRLGGV